MNITFRALTTADELAPLPDFERRIWGGGLDSVSVNVLVATITEGGMAIAAFDGDALVGVVYGFATREPDALHSHYMAVDPAYRRHGLGLQLKQRQREWCLARGITTVRWTYDPLQLGNAHLNLRRLGAVGISYHVDHYGTLGGINGDLPTDRVTVRWDLTGVRPAVGERRTVDVPPYTNDDIVRSTPAAAQARVALRVALQPALSAGWLLTDVDRAARRYTLER